MQGMQMDEKDARLLAPVTSGSLGVLSRLPMRSVMGSLQSFPKCFCPRNAQVRVLCRPASGHRQTHGGQRAERRACPAMPELLAATGKPLCLTINFGRPQVEIRRITGQA
jgi:hypothetical protein